MVLRCVYCHDDLGRRDRLFCAGCLAPHHAACRHTHGRCAGPGCDERHVVRPRLPRAPRTPAERPASPAARGRAGALLVGMAGVALGCAAVAAGLAVGELLMTNASVDAPVLMDVAPVEVLLTTDGVGPHPVGVSPGDRLVFVAGPTWIDVLRLDAGDTATWIWSGATSGIDVRLASGAVFTRVTVGSCPAVIAFDHEQATHLRRVAPAALLR